MDVRIKIATLFVSFASLAMLVGAFFSGMDDGGKSTFVGCLVVLGVITVLAGVAVKGREHEALMLALIVAYVWTAYPLKMLFIVLYPELSWVTAPEFFPARMVNIEIPESLAAVLPGLVGLGLGFAVWHTRDRRNSMEAPIKLRKWTFLFAVGGLLLLKAYCQRNLGIGLPGVRPSSLSVPFVVGILALAIGPVLLAVVNFFLYFAIRSRDWTATTFASLLALANIYLGLRVGYKSEMVYEAILLCYYFFSVKPHLSPHQYRILGMIVGASIFLSVAIYPFINYYRAYLLSGYEMSEAIESAKAQKSRNSLPMGVDLLNRVNGIDAFYVATKLGKDREFSISSLANSDVMDLFLRRLYGPQSKDAVTAFGATQFAVFYLIGGGLGLFLGAFLVGGAMRWIAYGVSNVLFKSQETFAAYLPLYVIAWVKFLSSGGLAMLYFKELGFVLFALLVSERLFVSRADMRYRVQGARGRPVIL